MHQNIQDVLAAHYCSPLIFLGENASDLPIYVLVAPNRLSLNFLNQNASKYQKFSCGSLLFAARFLMRKCFKLDKLFLAAHISVRRSISYAKMLQFAKIFLAAHIRSPLNFLWENASTLAQFPAAHCLYVIWKISAELLKRECYEIPNIFLLLTPVSAQFPTKTLKNIENFFAAHYRSPLDVLCENTSDLPAFSRGSQPFAA